MKSEVTRIIVGIASAWVVAALITTTEGRVVNSLNGVRLSSLKRNAPSSENAEDLAVANALASDIIGDLELLMEEFKVVRKQQQQQQPAKKGRNNFLLHQMLADVQSKLPNSEPMY